jgi:hypothetical protein
MNWWNSLILFRRRNCLDSPGLASCHRKRILACQFNNIKQCILLGAHELWARRTMCKSVFFCKVISYWQTIEACSGLKSRGLGDSATLPVGKKVTIVNERTRPRQCWINFSTQDIIWKNITQRCPSKADFTAEGVATVSGSCPLAKTTALKSGVTLTKWEV